jgi:hypothetical protein
MQIWTAGNRNDRTHCRCRTNTAARKFSHAGGKRHGTEVECQIGRLSSGLCLLAFVTFTLTGFYFRGKETFRHEWFACFWDTDQLANEPSAGESDAVSTSTYNARRLSLPPPPSLCFFDDEAMVDDDEEEDKGEGEEGDFFFFFCFF